MKLYGYYRSSTSYRVRIALNLKGLDYRQQPVNLLQGEHRQGPYRQLNPQGLVPTLETDEGERLTQSLAICEYLEERYPEPALLPADATDRARVRAIVGLLAIEIHPLNNLRVLKYLTGELGVDEDTKLGWYRHWITEGFDALEAMLAGDTYRPLLSRRAAGAGGRLPGAPGLQRRALQLRSGAVPHDPAHPRVLQ